MTIESSKPSVVLVHGALEDASIWHRVIPLLQSEGHPVIAFANSPIFAACWTGSRGR
jgi:pimeloyl-ACP methyl ester carboxylesterase